MQQEVVAQSILELAMSRKVQKHEEGITTSECLSGASMFSQLLEYLHIVGGQEIIAK